MKTACNAGGIKKALAVRMNFIRKHPGEVIYLPLASCGRNKTEKSCLQKICLYFQRPPERQAGMTY
jgi:hypothetical protein